MNISEVMEKYSAGEIGLEEANEKLKELNSPFHLDPEKNVLTEDEKWATTVGYYPAQANGWGLLDTATGSLDKVFVKDGKLSFAVNAINTDGTVNMRAYVLIAGHKYAVAVDTLTEKY
jgi:hypothetical protein